MLQMVDPATVLTVTVFPVFDILKLICGYQRDHWRISAAIDNLTDDEYVVTSRSILSHHTGRKAAVYGGFRLYILARTFQKTFYCDPGRPGHLKSLPLPDDLRGF